MTLAEALQYAAGRLDAATAAMTAIRDQVATQLGQTTGQATTIINNFVNRPPQQILFCDPVNGNDANDGATIGAPKKSIDAIITGMRSNATSVYLLADATIRLRSYLYAPLSIIGVQPSGNALGYAPATRKVGFLGAAENSPQLLIGSFCAGLFMQGGSLLTAQIDFRLPIVDAALNFRSHITALTDTSLSIGPATITVDGAGAGALIGSSGARTTATLANPVLGSGAPGHLFDGVAAGGDPNAQYAFMSNIKSA